MSAMLAVEVFRLLATARRDVLTGKLFHVPQVNRSYPGKN
jgi:hypothetical protein